MKLGLPWSLACVLLCLGCAKSTTPDAGEDATTRDVTPDGSETDSDLRVDAPVIPRECVESVPERSRFERVHRRVFSRSLARALSIPFDSDSQQVAGGFVRGGEFDDTSVLLEESVQQYIQPAKEAAGCTDETRACAESIIDKVISGFSPDFTNAERASLLALYNEQSDFTSGVTELLIVALNRPEFVFPLYYGDANGALTPAELKWRITRTLSASTPTKRFAEQTIEGVDQWSEAIDTLLREEPAGIDLFAEQWLQPAQPRNSQLPGDDMKTEATLFVRNAIVGGGGLTELFTGTHSYLNNTLRAHYGIGDRVDGFERIEFPEGQRAGALTLGGRLVRNGLRRTTDLRGFWIREYVLCEPVDNEPPDLDIEPPPFVPNATNREMIQTSILDVPECFDCHKAFTPMGFAFENFDHEGIFRTEEQGSPIDATGYVLDGEVERAVDGPADIGQTLLEMPQTQLCQIEHWIRYATFDEPDSCLVQNIDAALTESSGDIRVLLKTLFQSRSFTHRATTTSAATAVPSGTTGLEYLISAYQIASERLTGVEKESINTAFESLQIAQRRIDLGQ